VELEVESKYGEGGNSGGDDRGGIIEGFAVDGEKSEVELGRGKKGEFEVMEGSICFV